METQELFYWRQFKVTEQRTAIHFTHHCMKDLVDVFIPSATLIRVVLDNLNSHTRALLYKVFPKEEARRILSKLEFYYTLHPKTWKLSDYG